MQSQEFPKINITEMETMSARLENCVYQTELARNYFSLLLYACKQPSTDGLDTLKCSLLYENGLGIMDNFLDGLKHSFDDGAYMLQQIADYEKSQHKNIGTNEVDG